MEKLNKSQSQAALVQSINEGIKVQSQTRFQRINKRSQNEADSFDTNLPMRVASVESTTEPQPSTSGNRGSHNNDTDVSYSGQRSKKYKLVDDSKRDSQQLDVNTTDTATTTANDDIRELIFKPHPCLNDSSLAKFFTDDLKRCFKMSANATGRFYVKYPTY